ncbi:condensation domain-containing protein [Kitasatospora gansuensis]
MLNVPLAWRILGDLDQVALAAAIHAVVARHEALRTAFRPQDDIPVLDVRPPAEALLTVRQLTGPADLPELLAAFYARPFDLSSGRPLAALLLRLSDGESVLALNVHHAAIDAWSTGIVEAELGAAYRLAHRDQPLDLTTRYSLAEVVEELNGRHGSAAWAADLAHWVTQLRDVPGVVALPGALDRDDGAGFTAQQIRRRLPDGVRQKLTALARELDATEFQLLFAAYAGLLGRWANRDDFVLGVPMADRSSEMLQGAVLFATNVAPIRVRLADDPTFAELVGRVRRQLIDAIGRTSTPLSEILRAVNSGASEDVAGLAGLAMTYRNRPGQGLGLDGLVCEPYPVSTGRSLYQLACHIEHGDDGLVVQLEGRALDQDQLDGLWQRLVAVLAAVTDHPTAALSSWPTGLAGDLPDRAAAARPETGTVVDRFLRTAAELPQAVAVADPEQQLSYWQLRRQVQAVAGRLTEAGLRPGEVVAVCVGRGVGAVAALLGVMHAGGVYLPVDKAW